MEIKALRFSNCYIDINIAPNLWYNKITTINIYAKKVANLIIYQNSTNENTQNQFSDAIRELKIAKLLRKSNVTKSSRISAFEVFQFLLLLVFQGKNLYGFLNSKHKDQAVSKNTYYRFLNGKLFYMFCDDIQYMYLTNALTSLMALFVEHIINFPAEISNILKSKADEWIRFQALLFRLCLGIYAGKVE